MTETHLVFDTVAAFASTNIPAAVNFVDIAGFSVPGDGGGHRKVRIATPITSKAGQKQSADHSWWDVDASEEINAGIFGVLPSSAQDAFKLDTHFADLLAYVKERTVSAVNFRPGYHFFEKPLGRWPRNVLIRGSGEPGNWRVGPITSGFSQTQKSENCTVFIACDNVTAPVPDSIKKPYTLDWVTQSRQCGYDRVNPVGERQDLSEEFRRFHSFQLFDCTNLNAVGTKMAEKKPFSAFLAFEEGWGRIEIENIRIVTSCPGAGETQGVGGYTVSEAVLPWADWDFGIYVTNPWQLHMRNVQVVGYWRYGAHLSYGHLENPALLQSLGGTPHGESGLYENCYFQGGVVLRAPDVWPVLESNVGTATIRFTASHRWPIKGEFFASSSDTIAHLAQFKYDGLDFNNATDLENMRLAFKNVERKDPDTGNFAPWQIPVGAAIIPTFAAGHSHTKFANCVLTDFSHNAGLDDSNAVLNNTGFPGRPSYRAALEVSGAPMRAVNFENVVISPQGPLAIHMGTAKDVLFSGCYSEAKRGRVAPAGPNMDAGAIFIAGPKDVRLAEAGSKGGVSYNFVGPNVLNSNINVAPLRTPHPTARMRTMEDVNNPLPSMSIANHFLSEEPDTEITTAKDKWLLLNRRRKDGTTANVARARTATIDPNTTPPLTVDILELCNNAWQISDTYIRPATSNTMYVGQSNFRVGNGWFKSLHSTTALDVTSDARRKHSIESVTNKELEAAKIICGMIRRYKMVDGDDRWHYGVIAQEVEKVLKDRAIDAREIGFLNFNDGPDGDGFMSIAYDELQMLLIAAGQPA